MEDTQYHDPSSDGLRAKIVEPTSEDLKNSSAEINLYHLDSIPSKYNNEPGQFDNVVRRKRYGNEQNFNGFVSLNILFN